MKTLIFTSNLKHYHRENNKKVPNKLDNTNYFIDILKKIIPTNATILYVASSFNDIETNDSYSSLLFEGLRLSGIVFDKYYVLDNRTKENVGEFVKEADVIFISGGDTFLENKSLTEISFKELIKDYEGIIIGQSAGAINMATHVYNSPEEGKMSQNIYFEGLGLSNINVEPHFVLDTANFNGLELYQRKHILNESMKREIYAISDGAYIIESNNSITIFGESYLIKDGIITKLCSNGEQKTLFQNVKSK